MAATVHIVDDDPDVMTAIGRSLKADGLDVAMSRSSREFLDRYDPGVPGCIVVDLHMPDLDGLQLQQVLAENGHVPPLVFVSGSADVASCARAMRAGAIDFLVKPVEADVLLEAVLRGIQADAGSRIRHAEERAAGSLFNLLTVREREVLPHVIAGRLNKQIAADLGVALKTVKVHRARIMAKFQVRSVADLVRIAERAHVQAANRTR